MGECPYSLSVYSYMHAQLFLQWAGKARSLEGDHLQLNHKAKVSSTALPMLWYTECLMWTDTDTLTHPELWNAQGQSTELFIITEEEFETNLSKKHKIILDGTACSVRPCWVWYPRSVNQRTCTYTHALMVSLLTSIYRAQRKWNWKKERRGNIFFSFFFRQKANFPLSQPVLIPPHVWCTNVIIDAYTKEGPPSRTDSRNRGESFPNQSFPYGMLCRRILQFVPVLLYLSRRNRIFLPNLRKWND